MKKKIFSGLGLAGFIFIGTAFAMLYVAIHDGNIAAGCAAFVFAIFGIDASIFELTYAWHNGGLKDRYELWRKRRKWERRKLEHLQTILQSDSRWMAHNPVAAELTQRYLDAISEDWYTLAFPHSDKIRTKLNLEPQKLNTRQAVIVWRSVEHEQVQIIDARIIPLMLTNQTPQEYAQAHFDNIKQGWISTSKLPGVIDKYGPHTWQFMITNISVPNI